MTPVFLILRNLACLQQVRGGSHRLKNVDVAATAAEVSQKIVTNGLIVRVRMFVEQSNGGQDKAGGAEGALKACLVDKCLLNGVQMIAAGSSLRRL